MRSSYKKEDVMLLLKDITGLVQPQPAKERERLIQAGRHYCEMLPVEYVPSREYMEIYREALAHYSGATARAVGVLADKIMESKGEEVTLVSLARAGIPAGILLKRYLKFKYGAEVAHYAVSIIRGRGIDKNAMEYLLERYRPGQLLFVDGWIGKGAIQRELRKALQNYDGVSADIAALADPANVTELCGTHADILIPSSCLNSTVSGLVSRTFLRSDIIGEKDFHGAVYYGELEGADLSYEFIHAIEREFVKKTVPDSFTVEGDGLEEAEEIARHFGIRDVNLVKPGIGETTRVLLRRVPWKALVQKGHRKDPELAHIFRLAEEKGVSVEEYPLRHYRVCGLVMEM